MNARVTFRIGRDYGPISVSFGIEMDAADDYYQAALEAERRVVAALQDWERRNLPAAAAAQAAPQKEDNDRVVGELVLNEEGKWKLKTARYNKWGVPVYRDALPDGLCNVNKPGNYGFVEARVVMDGDRPIRAVDLRPARPDQVVF